MTISSFLENKGIHPSMLRKGNISDNGMIGAFFGLLNSEMFYGFEKEFNTQQKSKSKPRS